MGEKDGNDGLGQTCRTNVDAGRGCGRRVARVPRSGPGSRRHVAQRSFAGSSVACGLVRRLARAVRHEVVERFRLAPRSDRVACTLWRSLRRRSAGAGLRDRAAQPGAAGVAQVHERRRLRPHRASVRIVDLTHARSSPSSPWSTAVSLVKAGAWRVGGSRPRSVLTPSRGYGVAPVQVWCQAPQQAPRQTGFDHDGTRAQNPKSASHHASSWRTA